MIEKQQEQLVDSSKNKKELKEDNLKKILEQNNLEKKQLKKKQIKEIKQMQ